MIVTWFLKAFAEFVAFLLGLFPSIGVPSWVTDSSGYFATLLGYAAGMGVWIPWNLLVTVTAAVGACLVAGFAIKVVRIIASFLSAGGGSAA